MKYNCIIEKTDDWFIVTFPDMPNIQTSGETESEALEMANEALNGSLIVCLEKDLPIPDVKFKGGIEIEVSPKVAFAINLRKARANQTKKEVAAKLGMTYQQYQRLENPYKTNPTLEMMFRLQKTFGCKFLSL